MIWLALFARIVLTLFLNNGIDKSNRAPSARIVLFLIRITTYKYIDYGI